MKRFIRIKHKATGRILADGPLGWGITPFEGNYYIGRKYLRTDGFIPNFIPGFCPYKFLYIGMDLKLDDDRKSKHLIPGVYLSRSPSRSRSVVIARSEED